MCLSENAFAFVYIIMPTGESILGITSHDDPIDTTRTTTLKRKNTPYCKQYYNHEATKKRLSITLNFERPDYLKNHTPQHHSLEFIATCL
jgi:hypothetical protein